MTRYSIYRIRNGRLERVGDATENESNVCAAKVCKWMNGTGDIRPTQFVCLTFNVAR